MGLQSPTTGGVERAVACSKDVDGCVGVCDDGVALTARVPLCAAHASGLWCEVCGWPKRLSASRNGVSAEGALSWAVALVASAGARVVVAGSTAPPGSLSSR